jgi:hypothetical protein
METQALEQDCLVFGRRLMRRLRIVMPSHVGNRTIALFRT